MNDSLIVWTAVAVLVLVAVILYCLLRLLTRRPARPAPGGVTDREGDESVRVGQVSPEAVDDELAGPDLEQARGRARAATVQRAEQREAVAARAAAPAANVGAVESVDASPSGIDDDGHAAAVGAHAPPVDGIGAGPDVSSGIGVATSVGPAFDVGIADGVEDLQYTDVYEDGSRR